MCATTPPRVCKHFQHKRPLLVLGKSAKPRCFNNVKSFQTECDANKKVWMISEIFVKRTQSYKRCVKDKNEKSWTTAPPTARRKRIEKPDLVLLASEHDQYDTTNGPRCDWKSETPVPKAGHQPSPPCHREKDCIVVCHNCFYSMEIKC